MASPRPGTSASAQKSLAGKSPAVKTPASFHGHTHATSVTSHPSSTPMGAAAFQDELLNLNSPAAALMNSIAPTGMTPTPDGQNGLGMSTPLDSARGTKNPSSGGPGEERRRRLQQVADTLRTKVVGRGITREDVERVARLEGFEALWDEDNLTIAGDIVELDIHFHPLIKDRVLDLVLKFNPAEGEPQVQQEATGILKPQLAALTSTDDQTVRDDLHDFADNLQYLARMDRIGTTPSSFDMVGGLYKAFTDIWAEEKKRLTWRNDLQHACQGTVGRPRFDRSPRLGMTTDFWQDKHGLILSNEDAGPGNDFSSISMRGRSVYTGRVLFKSGSPSTTAPTQWLSESIIMDGDSSEQVSESSETRLRPAWHGSTIGLANGASNTDGDQMNIDSKHTSTPKLVDAHFVYDLASDLLVPMSAIMQLNSEIHMVNIDQTKGVTYQQALQQERKLTANSNTAATIDAKWTRRLAQFLPEGKVDYHLHSYALYSADSVSELWCYPISSLHFNHPRHFVTFLPLARQSAVIWALLRSLVVQPGALVEGREEAPSPKHKIVRRSNKKATNGTVKDRPVPAVGTLPIDVSLDLLSDASKATFSVLAPLQGQSENLGASRFMQLTFGVGLNGIIKVDTVAGLPDITNLQDKLGHMLSTAEDIGVVVQWVIEQTQQTSTS